MNQQRVQLATHADAGLSSSARAGTPGSPAAARMVRPNDHVSGFDLCAKAPFSQPQALVMARGFAARGLVDMSEGCTHYALRLTVKAAHRDQS